jgi:hypothetical protein
MASLILAVAKMALNRLCMRGGIVLVEDGICYGYFDVAVVSRILLSSRGLK